MHVATIDSKLNNIIAIATEDKGTEEVSQNHQIIEFMNSATYS